MDSEAEPKSLFEKPALILWMVGSPGTRISEHCCRLEEDFDFSVVSIPRVVEFEKLQKTKRGAYLRAMEANCIFLPNELIVKLLKEEIVQELMAKEHEENVIIIEQFPEEVEQGLLFEQMIGPADKIVYFAAPYVHLVQEEIKNSESYTEFGDELAEYRMDNSFMRNEEVLEYYADKVVPLDVTDDMDTVADNLGHLIDTLLKKKKKIYKSDT